VLLIDGREERYNDDGTSTDHVHEEEASDPPGYGRHWRRLQASQRRLGLAQRRIRIHDLSGVWWVIVFMIVVWC
jgi:hypothetical protein